jgi:hypothetical protein
MADFGPSGSDHPDAGPEAALATSGRSNRDEDRAMASCFRAKHHGKEDVERWRGGRPDSSGREEVRSPDLVHPMPRDDG